MDVNEKTLLLMVGLPQSGKTTVAMELGFPIVSPDAIRLSLHGQAYMQTVEDLVWSLAKLMVRSLFEAGHHSVIVDATNNTRKRRDAWRQDEEWNLEYHILDTPQKLCIQRAQQNERMDLMPAIERMAEAHEPVVLEERHIG